MDFSNIFLLVPAYDPDNKILNLIDDLKKAGFSNIVVIDDGSKDSYKQIFTEIENKSVIVLHHSKNEGKGAAIKTGIQEICNPKYASLNITNFITADSGYHYLVEDIVKVAEKTIETPDSIILGTRDFSSKDIPLKAKISNKLSSAFFKMSIGKKCPDTETGLRSIPMKLSKIALEEEGKRYEYEMDFLMDAVLLAPIEFVPVTTIIEKKRRHYHPIIDTIRVYGRFIKFVFSSLLGWIVDIIIFSIATFFLKRTSLSESSGIWIGTILGRIFAGIINFIMNKYWSFHNNESKNSVGQVMKYFVVFMIKLVASAEIVSLLNITLLKVVKIPLAIIKSIVDTTIFFISYRLQKVWVFKKSI